jgi:hypothetical protein
MLRVTISLSFEHGVSERWPDGVQQPASST